MKRRQGPRFQCLVEPARPSALRFQPEKRAIAVDTAFLGRAEQASVRSQQQGCGGTPEYCFVILQTSSCAEHFHLLMSKPHVIDPWSVSAGIGGERWDLSRLMMEVQ
jgi:hypothetical protein